MFTFGIIILIAVIIVSFYHLIKDDDVYDN